MDALRAVRSFLKSKGSTSSSNDPISFSISYCCAADCCPLKLSRKLFSSFVIDVKTSGNFSRFLIAFALESTDSTSFSKSTG